MRTSRATGSRSAQRRAAPRSQPAPARHAGIDDAHALGLVRPRSAGSPRRTRSKNAPSSSSNRSPAARRAARPRQAQLHRQIQQQRAVRPQIACTACRQLFDQRRDRRRGPRPGRRAWHRVKRSQITQLSLRAAPAGCRFSRWIERAANISSVSASARCCSSPRASTSARSCSASGVPPGSRVSSTASPRARSAASSARASVDLPAPSMPSRLMNLPLTLHHGACSRLAPRGRPTPMRRR